MTLPVEFDDTDEELLDFLRPKLPGIFLSNGIPNPRRNEMVIVRNDGGPQVSVVSEMQRYGVTVMVNNVDGTGKTRVTKLARTVQMHLTTATNVGPFVKIDKTGGPYAIDDPSGWPTRYLTFEVLHKGTAPA